MNKPKVPTGLSQKGNVVGTGLLRTLSWTANTTGVQRAPHPCWSTVRNVVSPYRSFRKEGRKAVRLPDGGAGMGVRGSECPPVVGGIRVATSPDAKAG